MAHIVKCRWCGVSFDTDILDSDKWIMANKRYYYHKDCYEEKQKPNAIRPVTNENKETEFNTWRQNIFDFIQRDLKGKCNYSRITQMMEMYKNKYKDWTYKGMFYALKYFYDIKQNDWSKANGAIGILPYIYYEGTEYRRKILHHQERRCHDQQGKGKSSRPGRIREGIKDGLPREDLRAHLPRVSEAYGSIECARLRRYYHADRLPSSQ